MSNSPPHNSVEEQPRLFSFKILNSALCLFGHILVDSERGNCASCNRGEKVGRSCSRMFSLQYSKYSKYSTAYNNIPDHTHLIFVSTTTKILRFYWKDKRIPTQDFRESKFLCNFFFAFWNRFLSSRLWWRWGRLCVAKVPTNLTTPEKWNRSFIQKINLQLESRFSRNWRQK